MDFYVILGVERTATASDVKRAYRRLARKHHPDINPGDQEAEAFFRRVSEAYETLIDPERRQDYDTHGRVRPGPEGVNVEFEGFDFSEICSRMCSPIRVRVGLGERALTVSTCTPPCGWTSRPRCAEGPTRSP